MDITPPMLRKLSRVRFERKLVWFCCLVLLWGYIPRVNADDQRVTILFFYTRTCPDCRFIKHEFLPKIGRKYQNQLRIKYFEITSIHNFELLLSLEKHFHRKIDKTPPLIIVGDDILEGESIIRTKLEQTIDKYLKSGVTEWSQFGYRFNHDRNLTIIAKFRELTPLMIISGGLLDGINPCAFATLIFLISYLSMVGRKGKELFFSGINFTIGVFIAYFLVGYGLLELLNRFSSFRIFGNLISYIMAMILGLLCIVSFYDYILVKRGKPNEIKLQLNDHLKQRIHAVIRKQTRLRLYLAMSFILGFIVALYEFPCTGQIYLPIIFVLKGISTLKLTAILYLALYNLMFILPLIIVFSFVYWGVTSNQFAEKMRKYLGSIKLLSALWFGLLAVLLLFLH